MSFVKGQIVFHKNLERVGEVVHEEIFEDEVTVSFKEEGTNYTDELRVTKNLLVLGASKKPTLETIDDLIDEWHESDSRLKLHQYLGLTWEEYKNFVENHTL